jgi:hypothetical protein
MVEKSSTTSTDKLEKFVAFLQDDAIVVAGGAVQYLETGSGTTRKPESW